MIVLPLPPLNRRPTDSFMVERKMVCLKHGHGRGVDNATRVRLWHCLRSDGTNRRTIV